MRFSNDTKENIKNYILEKIDSGCKELAKTVSANLDINESTIYRYLNEMQGDGLIVKDNKDGYSIVSDRKQYHLSKDKGELKDEMKVMAKYVEPCVTDFPPNVRAIWQYSVSEMVNNIIDHSGAENLYIQIIQNALYTEVQLRDDGVGIFDKIKDYFSLDSYDEVLIELIKGKLTTDEENHSGEGIFFSSRCLDEFFILSKGIIFSSNEFDAEEILGTFSEESSGTLFVMRLSNKSKKEIADIFNRYSSVEEGFYKTSFPLKNFFPDNPISRSQAKRVCERLQEFTEVEIDFNNIEWMGQGFADQLFRVFPSKEPSVKIKPVNMSETVEKMYRHIVGKMRGKEIGDD